MFTRLFLFFASRYAQWALAAQNQGFLGFIGLAKETTWGTAVGATDWLEFLSENVVHSIDRFPTRNAFGGFYEPDDYAGVRRIGGTFATFANAISMQHLLKACFNTISQSTVLSGFLYTNHFSTTKSEYADGVPCQPYTIEIARDANVNSSHQFAGMVCNKLTMHCVPNQDLRLTADWIGQLTTPLIARTTPTFPGSPVKPFAFDTASITLAGVANARVEMLQIEINNNLEGIPALNNSSNIARMRRKGVQEVRIRGTLDFVDNTEWLDFYNQTERALTVNFFTAQSFNCYIQIPRMVYTAMPVAISGRGRITTSFDGIARYQTTSGVAIDVAVTATRSNY